MKVRICQIPILWLIFFTDNFTGSRSMKTGSFFGDMVYLKKAWILEIDVKESGRYCPGGRKDPA